jgi:hypothetical protein
MNQVHKENLDHVENALANRQGLDTEIFGMEGIPEDILQQHNQRIIQNFYTAQAERHAATGNPPSGAQGPTKKIKVETPEEIKKRLADHRARIAAQKAGGTGSAGATPADGQSPGQSVGWPAKTCFGSSLIYTLGFPIPPSSSRLSISPCRRCCRSRCSSTRLHASTSIPTDISSRSCATSRCIQQPSCTATKQRYASFKPPAETAVRRKLLPHARGTRISCSRCLNSG